MKRSDKRKPQRTDRPRFSMATAILKNPQATAMYTLAVMGVAAVAFFFTPYPIDDFLRHARYLDYKSLGGYAYMYPNSSMGTFPGSQWIGFDYLAGYAYRFLGPHLAIRTFATAFCLLAFAAMTKTLRFPNPDSKPFAMPLFATLSYMVLALPRISLIRPSILLAILLIIGINGRRTISGFILAALSAALHHIFYVYTIPLAIAHFLKGSRRFSYGLAAGTVAGIAAWNIATSGTAFAYIIHLVGLALTKTPIRSTEAESPLPIIFSNYAYFLVVTLFVLAIARTKRIDLITLLIAITAPYAILARFLVDITLPLMVIYVHNNLEFIQEAFSSFRKSLVPMTLLLLVSMGFVSAESNRSRIAGRMLEGIKIPAGSTVYTDPIGRINYALAYWNKDPIRMYPSPEMRGDDKDTITMSMDILAKNAIPQSFCYYAARNKVNYLLTVMPERTNCLILIQSRHLGNYIADLWAVSPLPLGPVPPQPEAMMPPGKK